jgi:hypothetical protein
MTGKAEQMPSVVHEFVHVAPMKQRSSSLLCADEVDRQQHQQAAKHGPGQKLVDGNNGKKDGLSDRTGGRVGHVETSWDRASRVELIGDEGRTWLLTMLWSIYSGATAPESHRLLRFTFESSFEPSGLGGHCQGKEGAGAW